MQTLFYRASAIGMTIIWQIYPEEYYFYDEPDYVGVASPKVYTAYNEADALEKLDYFEEIYRLKQMREAYDLKREAYDLKEAARKQLRS